MAPRAGLEPATTRLTAGCSTIELPRNVHGEHGVVLHALFFKNFLAVTYSPGEYSPVPSALEGLTAVFGMGTGVSPPLLPPEIFWRFYCLLLFVLSKLPSEVDVSPTLLWSSPRPISTGPLKGLPLLHSRPIYLVVFQGSYWLLPWETSS